ncbi:hypothetical protein PAXINDRAFT_157366 [Paxillus involutus ATCC 200175]|uniref:Uncharacterized protein n=1 Tax=Paxillus involutus ATCC 200175 TaxID=664439 RepID=A0A0C9SSH9_PAXIN|nr:hypothetical protein PAXINDRAFT_157366 [Paxillus involutus ATCC 200175]
MHYTSTAPTSSPAPLSAVLRREKVKEARGSEQEARSKRTEEGQFLMNQRFQPYKRRKAPPPLELRFAMRSLGHSSVTDIDFEDIVEGKHIFERGLSTLSPNVIKMAYRAQLATKQCILSRINTTLAELDATEKRSDFLRAVKEEHEKELSVVSEELQCVKDVVVGQGIDIDDHIAFSHAVYAEELVALTMSDMQLHQLSMIQGRQMVFGGDNDKSSSSSDVSTSDSSEVDPTDLDRYDDVKYDE